MNRILIDLPEVIETSKLKLQMPKAGYGKGLYQAMMDGYEDCIKWLNWSSTPPTLESVEEECRKHHAEFILRNCIRYLIIDKATNNIVGRCAFPPIQSGWSVPQFGIAYFIRKSQRSKGYATTATHIMALLAFRSLKAKKVEIHCDAENLPSIQIPLKLGFKLEYSQKGGWLRQDNTLAELKTFSIFSEDELLHLEIDLF
ncbi:GNAT family N-acetyltransferase [Rickettsia endosymbiont of Lasioglossum villosulum]|uniref:GNAT family N-acetyltransferase n=1 Tax=Rickettsia endosymbiont of Lasioglossum villosulum TaxID=3066269 RepID=UPI003133520F